MATYVLRQIDDVFWRRVQARAASEGKGLKGAIMSVLALYAEVGLAALEDRARHAELPPPAA